MPAMSTTHRTMPPGIVTGAAYADLDALGTAFPLDVPRSGIIASANYYDRDDEGLAVDLWLFRERPSTQTDNAALALAPGEISNVITVISFVSFKDANTAQHSEVNNIGKAYKLANEVMWAQVQARGALNIAANAFPMFSLTILPD